MSAGDTLYLKIGKNVVVTDRRVTLGDVAKMECTDQAALRHKLFGLSIKPERLSEIRNERRPGSRYASIENCREEIRNAEALMTRNGIEWLNSTTKSIEEIAATIVAKFHLQGVSKSL